MLVETWREALETQFTEYTANHYKHGVCAVFAQSRSDCMSLVACIEDHQFQPKNYWFVSFIKINNYYFLIYCKILILIFEFCDLFLRNGRWRSQWCATLSGGSGELQGTLRVQVCLSSHNINLTQ